MGSAVFSSTYSMSGYTTKTYNVRISYSESYDQTSNRSTIRITGVELQIVGNGTNWGSLAFYGSVAVNGTTLLSMNGGASVRVSLNGSGYCSVAIPASSSITVAHNADGGGAFTLAVSGGFSYSGSNYFCALYNNQPFGVKSQSKNVSLTAHPRGSSIASVPSQVETQGTLSLSVSRNSASFWHKATVLVGSDSLYESAAFETSVSIPVPRSWFADYPALDELAATVAVQTYTDASCTTAIGSPATASLAILADADMRPVVTTGWATVSPYNTGAVAGIVGYVKGYSQAEVTFDSTKIDLSDTAGASITGYAVQCQGETISASPWRTGVLTATAVTVTCTVTDSRGRTGSETFTLTVMDYARPSLSGIEIFRCSVLGIEDEEGTHYSAKATLQYSALDGQNSCTLTSAAAPSGGSYGTTENLTSGTAHVSTAVISADGTYIIRIQATDALGNTAVYYQTLATRKWAMKFRPDGNGVAFGKAAEYGATLEIPANWDFKFGGVSWLNKVYPVGSIYMSVNNTNPGTLFGGTWAQIEDVFLLAAGQTYNAGDTGGAATHTLTVTEMPEHEHDGLYWGVDYKANAYPWGLNNDGVGNGFSSTYSGTRGGPNDSHAMYTGKAGGGQAFSVMPPYLAVYVWQRTA